MRKILTLLFALLVSAASFAGNTVKVVKSINNAKAILGKNLSAVATIDWSEVKYDNSKDMHDVWGIKYDYFAHECTEKFISGFNENSNGLQVATDAQHTKYSMTVNLTNIDKYFNVMNIVPGHTVKIWATVVITSEQGDKVMEIEVDSMKGSRDFSPDDCYTKAFHILGKRVAKAMQ